MNPRVAKLREEREKNTAKIASLQERNKKIDADIIKIENTDILDMQLPKHSFTFLKKLVDGKNSSIQCVYASDFLKRNTDSLKNAVENDLFSIAPDLEKIYEIEEL